MWKKIGRATALGDGEKNEKITRKPEKQTTQWNDKRRRKQETALHWGKAHFQNQALPFRTPTSPAWQGQYSWARFRWQSIYTKSLGRTKKRPNWILNWLSLFPPCFWNKMHKFQHQTTKSEQTRWLKHSIKETRLMNPESQHPDIGDPTCLCQNIASANYVRKTCQELGQNLCQYGASESMSNCHYSVMKCHGVMSEYHLRELCQHLYRICAIYVKPFLQGGDHSKQRNYSGRLAKTDGWVDRKMKQMTANHWHRIGFARLRAL